MKKWLTALATILLIPLTFVLITMGMYYHEKRQRENESVIHERKVELHSCYQKAEERRVNGVKSCYEPHTIMTAEERQNCLEQIEKSAEQGKETCNDLHRFER